MRELDEVADICGKGDDLLTMEEIAEKTAKIAGKVTEKMEEVLKVIRTFSQKQVEDARLGNREKPTSDSSHWSVFRGTLEGAPVMVLVLKPVDSVDDTAWQTSPPLNMETIL